MSTALAFSTTFGRQIRSNRLATSGAIILFVVVVAALLGPLLMHGDPNQMNVLLRNKPMSWAHPFGTDYLGRDIALRMAYGARLSLFICVSVSILCFVSGTFFGLLAGYFRGWVDVVISRAVDALMAFPSILLALGVVATLGSSTFSIIVTLAIVYMPRVIRVARAPTLAEAEKEYVLAARSCGVSAPRILFAHVFPNILAPVIVQATVIFAYAMVAEAALGFLGLGVPPPTATWGALLADARRTLFTAPTQTLFPALGLALTVLGINLLGDGLRDILDPRSQRAQSGGGL
jgi:peptide/nickel transport system permease protein